MLIEDFADIRTSDSWYWFDTVTYDVDVEEWWNMPIDEKAGDSSINFLSQRYNQYGYLIQRQINGEKFTSSFRW